MIPKAAACARAAGLDLRTPMLDPRIVDLAGRVPDSLRARAPKTKILMRRALAGRLPEGVVSGPKQGFSSPVRRWFRGDGAAWLRGLLSPRRLAETGAFRPERVEALMSGHAAGRIDASGILLALAILELRRGTA
jgi:asparagine synthase (glutamine-hydrolysing)